MATYRIAPDLKARFTAAINLLTLQGITGGMYRYKRGECSCCYGREGARERGEFYELNENIPGNWGIHGSGEGYHKISFAIGDTPKEKRENLKKAQRVADTFRAALTDSGWFVNWGGDLYSAILIEDEPRKMDTLAERKAASKKATKKAQQRAKKVKKH